jgi:hypothetical protein
MTDGRHFYRTIGRTFPSHEFVDHSKDEYVRGDVTTNTVEGFFGQLKSSLDGTYHHVSRQHLQRYLNEFDYRYSTRPRCSHLQDSYRFCAGLRKPMK